jgi:hypothetical protein
MHSYQPPPKDKTAIKFDICVSALIAIKKRAEREGLSTRGMAERLLYAGLWPTHSGRSTQQDDNERAGLDRFLGNAERTVTIEEKR